MRVISKKKFTDAAKDYPKAASGIMDAYKALKAGNFLSSSELRKVFGTLDRFTYIDKYYVIDIAGNDLRFIGRFEFVANTVYAKHIFTHAEYEVFTNSHRRKGKIK